MRYRFIPAVLILLLVPFLASCQFTPEDKWPVVTDWQVEGDIDVKLFVHPVTCLWYFRVPNREVQLTVDVRTYHCNQGFTAYIVLQRVRKEYTVYVGEIPFSFHTEDIPPDQLPTVTDEPVDDPWGDPTETIIIDGITGTYVAGSGHPPQGITQLVLEFEARWFGVSMLDWFFASGPGIARVERYTYLYQIIIEDQGGRTDTFNIYVVSELV